MLDGAWLEGIEEGWADGVDVVVGGCGVAVWSCGVEIWALVRAGAPVGIDFERVIIWRCTSDVLLIGDEYFVSSDDWFIRVCDEWDCIDIFG